jgi:hypothetical protein
MKKVLMLLIIPVIFASVTLAQGFTNEGIKVGLNFSNLRGSGAPSGSEYKKDFVVGGFITYSIDNDFAVQPEVYYTKKGYQVTRSYLGRSSDQTTLSIAYIEIPVLLKYTLAPKGKTTPGFFAGPAIGFKRSGKYKIKEGSQTQDGELQNITATDYGIVIGADWRIALSSGAVLIDMRYDLGFSNIVDTNPSPVAKNQTISILLGYSF